MTHAPFPAPVVHAAALAVHTRLRAEADENGIGTVSPGIRSTARVTWPGSRLQRETR